MHEERYRTENTDLSAIEGGLRQLMRLKANDGPNTELDWEIKVYEYILHAPNSKAMAIQYMEARFGGWKERSKREAVEHLGWQI